MLFPLLFVILTFSLSKVIVAVTGSVVSVSVLYIIVPIGASLYIQLTLAVITPLLRRIYKIKRKMYSNN